jgi:hypothetical protein
MLRPNRALLALSSAGLLAACHDASAPTPTPLRAASTEVAAATFSLLMSFGTGADIDANGYAEGGLAVEADGSTIEDFDGNGERELVGDASIFGLVVTTPNSQIRFKVEDGTAVGLLRSANTGALVMVVVATAPANATFTHLPVGSFYLEVLQSGVTAAVVDDISIGLPSADATPPVIVPTVTGTLGSNGWYTSNVSVSWSVTDAESAVIPGSGCDATVVSTDTPEITFTCSASSEGGSASNSVTVKRDASAPLIAFSGSTSYTVDQTVAISCSATDPTSGIATQSCPAASGAAYTFALGSNTLNASATNGAGLTASASLSFSVTVDYASLAALTASFVTNPGVANALNAKLTAAATAPNASARAGMLRAYMNEVRAQTGKSISAEHAAILLALAASL